MENKENYTLATEMLHELKASAKRWFIAFIVVLVLWFATIGVFIWYISLPVETQDVTVENEDGNANYAGRDMNGVFNGENNSKENTESRANEK